jgi:modulator of FtsH protease HflC
MPIHRSRVLLLFVLVLFGLILLLGPAFCYTVDERELAVVLQFGKPVALRTEPGLYFKTPLTQEVRKLPKTMQFWGGSAVHTLPDLPTADGKKINVIPWAIWRINDPIHFVQLLRDVDNAERRVSEIVRGAMRDAITQHDLSELVRSTSRQLTHTFGADPRILGTAIDELKQHVPETAEKVTYGREKILAQIKQDATRRLASDISGAADAAAQGSRGIELVDVGIAKIDFVPTVRQAAFERQIALMQSIASLYTNEGERAKQEILNRTNAEVQRIEGEGQQQANQTKGEVDAEIIRSYAQAIQEASEFYTFVRTLEAYKKALGTDTRLILTTDSDFFRLLKEAPTASEPARVHPIGSEER